MINKAIKSWIPCKQLKVWMSETNTSNTCCNRKCVVSDISFDTLTLFCRHLNIYVYKIAVYLI